MCGIAGFIGKSSDWQTEIRSMCDRIKHRGPDAEGIWSAENTEVVLGHRRLSVLDITSNGNQPMISSDCRYVISYNGEIYNYKEIEKYLIKKNIILKTQTDTEVLLEAIAEWGISEILERARGMFAFALFDRQENVVYLARDKMGEKPLYYGMVGRHFAFASDIVCFEKMHNFSNSINQQALKLYFQHGYIPTPYSIYEGIYKLEPGTILKIDVNNFCMTSKVYWSIEDVAISGQQNLFKGTEREAAEELERILKETISMQMLADVPVGAFLSAGIDSSTVVAIMQNLSNVPVKTFTIGLEDQAYNEAVLAKKIAKILGTEHTELYISEKEAQAIIPELGMVYSEPFADSSQIPMMIVSALAKKQVTVALSGDGGDELFAGYNYYEYVKNTWHQICQIPRPIRKMIGGTFDYVPMISRMKMARKGEFLRCTSPENLYNWDRKRGFNQAIFKQKIEAQSKNDECRNWIFDECQQNIMLMDLQMYHPDDILVKVDRAAMAYSLETRIPMLDSRVIEFAWSLPFQYKKNNGVTKKPLRNILYKYIPQEIMERPKTGFSIPINNWLVQGKLKEWAEDLITGIKVNNHGIFNYDEIYRIWKIFSENGAGAETIWRLLVFEEWMQKGRNHL